MASRVYFAFHYQDVIGFRVNVVRNHWVVKPGREEAGYFDASIWESARRTNGLKRLINSALENTSNTCVLIGSATFGRPWVRYEMLKSFRRGNHLFGVHINGIKNKGSVTHPLGVNPLEYVGVSYSVDGQTGTLWEKNGGAWARYGEIDGSADFACNVGLQYRGKGFNLSGFYPTYDWLSQDGYNAFPGWVA